jgi:hypothetical protein
VIQSTPLHSAKRTPTQGSHRPTASRSCLSTSGQLPKELGSRLSAGMTTATFTLGSLRGSRSADVPGEYRNLAIGYSVLLTDFFGP